MFAHIDGNSFYCSCERAFDPSLRGKPLVVLSNNDGCVIARTQEAKDHGIKMGEPWHLAKKRPDAREVLWRSSNYSLYGDMSRRMFEVLCGLVPSVEPYSIDEMFLDFTGLPDMAERAASIRATVLRATKIPTCVGIGPTKTIAKLANGVAKSDRRGSDVCDLSHADTRARMYAELPASEVWGIGPASALKLKQLGVNTIAEFQAMPREAVRQLLTVVGTRIQTELDGVSCLSLSTAPAPKKSLAVTRSFGRPIEDWPSMQEAFASYASRAAEKLRRHGLVAGAMQVFVMTNRFSKTDKSYSSQTTFDIEPTNDTLRLMESATRAAERLWREGYRYQKAGVVLLDLVEASHVPAQLLPSVDEDRRAALMRALDSVNQRYGRRSLRPAIMTPAPAWGARQGNVSPRYTTRAADIMRVRA